MSYGSIFAELQNKNAFYGLLTQSPTATGWAKQPKLTLLFDSTRDGWTGPAFHQKCDGQGPTVSVCRTQDGTVCGGFTQVNWGSPNGAYQPDPSAFLFRLKFRGTAAPYRSGVGNRSHDVYCNNDYGPTFGGHDLILFRSNSFQGSYAYHNTSHYQYPPDPLTVGTGYPLTGGYQQMIQAGGQTYRVEVYSLQPYSDDQPAPVPALPKKDDDDELPLLWSGFTVEPECSAAACEALRRGISRLVNVHDEMGPVNIALVGPVGSGKSSLIRSVESALKGELEPIEQVR